MGVVVMQTGAGARLAACEVELLAGLERRFGRATLLVPTFAERDACRRELARAGCGLGVEATTPAAWIAALWELFGDGRRLVGSFERQALIAAILDASESADIAPLRNNPGTVRLLACMARDLAPYAAEDGVEGADGASALAEADDMVLELLEAYRVAADARGFVEASEAAELLVREFDGRPPACLRAVAVRDVARVPAYLQRLLALVVAGDAGGEGEVAWLLGAGQEPFADSVVATFERMACPVSHVACDAGLAAAAGPCDGSRPVATVGGRAPHAAVPGFLEVAGPHARTRAYADEVLRLLDADAARLEGPARAEGRAKSGGSAAACAPAATPCAPAAPEAVLAHPRPTEAFFELAPRLAVAGARSRARVRANWNESWAGQQFSALVDLAARMEEAGTDPLRAGEWWPAPELSDWLACPLSGVDAGLARGFDKDVRGHRGYSAEQVARKLQSVQGRQRAARAKLDAGHPYAGVPAVCADVWQAICGGRPVSALKAMLEVAEALPASAFGSAEGRARQQLECSLLEAAIDAVGARAHELEVSQRVAVTVLDSLSVSLTLEAGPCTSAGGADDGAKAALQTGAPSAAGQRGLVRFMRLDEAALVPAGSVAGLLLADCDVESYPLKRDENLETTLAGRLGRAPLVMEPACMARTQFQRALSVPALPAVLARVTHDGQAKDRYPAAMWTELLAAAKDGAQRTGVPLAVRCCDEGDIVCDFDPRSGAGLRLERATCLPAQELSARAASYLVLRERAVGPEGGVDSTADSAQDFAPLVPRRLSASQIESYCTCPLCWFMGSRVRPQAIDAGFGNMEKGNLVHDVMERFHRRLAEDGVARATPENVDACLEVLRAAFAEVRAEHACGKTASSAPLVPLSTLEAVQVDEILPMLEEALRYEARALPPFRPALAEFSFDGQGVLYAGRPLGGRIDRVDVDEAGRAVIIDYKHRANVEQFKLKDPTVPDKKSGAVPADDPRWLPEHPQALIYAQALRRMEQPLDTRGALYFSTKSMRPAMRGAVAEELVDQVPDLKEGFPGEGGTMGFDELLDRVECGVAMRLDELEAGCIRAPEEQASSCSYNHALGFGAREE